MRAAIAASIAAAITSPTLRATRRRVAALRRAATGSPATVHYFHDATDPYSALTAQMLAPLEARYRLTLIRHDVSPPQDSAAPERSRLLAWSARDAAALAALHHLDLALMPCPPGTAGGVAEGDALRARLGHYLGATFYYGGEWYWGLDRLHYLETRLAAERLDTAPGAPLLTPVRDVTLAGPAGIARGHVLHFFLSFRSPYTCIAVPRVRALAAHYGAELRLRPVLPMVMRGLPVPWAKRLYILRDTKREAERLGLPFGRAVDPVGPGVERGLAVLHAAIEAGCGAEFAQSFLTGVFAEGIDATSDRGLHRMAARAGLSQAALQTALADQSWRAQAEANRTELLQSGLWGVPSFRVDDRPAVWGQDRLWMIERDLTRSDAASRDAPSPLA